MWMVPPSRVRSSHPKSPSSSSSSTTWSASVVSVVGSPLNLDNLPQRAIIDVLKRCDPVSISRVSRVCSSLRSAVVSEMDRPNPLIEPSYAFGRIFIPDRRRVILEKLDMDSSDRERGRRERKECENVLSVSPPSARQNGRENSERSLSYCTVRSLSSEHSIKDFLDTVYEKTVPTMRERLTPRKANFEADQMAPTSEPSWAYKFDLAKWMEDYDITEVCLQNFANFLEREGGQMADAPSTSGEYSSFNPTPPWTSHNSPEGQGNVNTMMPMGAGQSKYHSLHSTRSEVKGTVYDTMNEEHMADNKVVSSGRFERLASKLAAVNPLHLVFRDHSLYGRRPVHLVFWFISLLRPNLRRITLDSLQSRDRIRVEGALPLNNIEQLNIKQARENPALVVNEEILLSWLRLPAAERAKIRVRFQNCRRLSPKGLCRFIREWQMYPEVAEFDSIIVDDDSMHPWELVEEAEKDIMSYDKQDHYLRPRQTDLPAYVTSKYEMCTVEQAESLKRTMEFRHSKGRRAIKYYYEDGLLILSITTPSSPRPRSPPSPSSSNHLLIGCSSHRSSIPSRPGSLPRENSTTTTSSPLFHSYHPPPATPSMFGRILQILRSNA
ncbi:hypothetical protein PFISCL1PPCAC_1952 [Pristionchus fissidentatus]|uniref:F-box domain-containing protein n=1 Tax=Pristionchus fissidentatus TaxID=1538716 RepID=A0AAV5UTU4_9BILA|nr:hypothetical protein PFISCL1PPCAC_1952 [Pristionchus fissidentatus]